MRQSPAKFTEKQREFWNAINDYIRENEGFTVSESHTVNIIFQCRPDSDLPEWLKAKGYKPNSAGTTERLMPVTELVREHGSTRKIIRQHIQPTEVSVYQFELPFCWNRIVRLIAPSHSGHLIGEIHCQ
jgi:hypothetical protein